MKLYGLEAKQIADAVPQQHSPNKLTRRERERRVALTEGARSLRVPVSVLFPDGTCQAALAAAGVVRQQELRVFVRRAAGRCLHHKVFLHVGDVEVLLRLLHAEKKLVSLRR